MEPRLTKWSLDDCDRLIASVKTIIKFKNPAELAAEALRVAIEAREKDYPHAEALKAKAMLITEWACDDDDPFETRRAICNIDQLVSTWLLMLPIRLVNLSIEHPEDNPLSYLSIAYAQFNILSISLRCLSLDSKFIATRTKYFLLYITSDENHTRKLLREAIQISEGFLDDATTQNITDPLSKFLAVKLSQADTNGVTEISDQLIPHILTKIWSGNQLEAIEMCKPIKELFDP